MQCLLEAGWTHIWIDFPEKPLTADVLAAIIRMTDGNSG